MALEITKGINSDQSLTCTADPYCHAEGFGTSATTGSGGHAEGYSTTATNGGHAEGDGSTATGTWAHAQGILTTANGEAAHAQGNRTTASGAYSNALGVNTISDHYGEFGIGNGSPATYYGQSGQLVFQGLTTTNGQSELTLDGSTSYFSVQSGAAYQVVVSATAVNTSTKACASWDPCKSDYVFLAANQAGTMAITDTGTKYGTALPPDYTLGTIPGLELQYGIDNSNHRIYIKVTGISATNLHWVVDCKFIKVI